MAEAQRRRGRRGDEEVSTAGGALKLAVAQWAQLPDLLARRRMIAIFAAILSALVEENSSGTRSLPALGTYPCQ